MLVFPHWLCVRIKQVCEVLHIWLVEVCCKSTWVFLDRICLDRSSMFCGNQPKFILFWVSFNIAISPYKHEWYFINQRGKIWSYFLTCIIGCIHSIFQFFLELMRVPRMESKLRVFFFKIQFNSQVWLLLLHFGNWSVWHLVLVLG